MKNIKIFGFIFLFLTLLAGCKEDDILFQSEKPYFPVREGYQLLEVIVPYLTAQTDKIYITGEFNGGNEAIGNPMWQLEKAPGYDFKFGIYLDPYTFVEGKSLKDGYTFYNIQRGPERSLDNQPVLHYEAPGLGQRLDVLVNAWEDNFNQNQNPDEVTHDGYAIYVIDETGYTDLALYAWGDAEIFGGWPGIQPTGKIELNGVTYKYFDTGAENEDLNVNLIFNNNGGGSQLPDFNVTLNKDYYLQLTSEGVTEYDPNDSIEHDGYTVYVYNNTSWTNVFLYMWGDVNDLNGGWPGMEPTGSIVSNGVVYLYFDMGEANAGLAENLIFNNGDGTQLSDFGFTIDRDIYLEITASGVTEIDPNTFQPGGGSETPEDPTPTPGEVRYLYVQNNTSWDPLYLYTWNTQGTELCGGWPGIQSSGTKDIAGVTYSVFEVTSDSLQQNLIFSDGTGGEDGVSQTVSFAYVLDQDYYFNLTPTSLTEVEFPDYTIYVDNQTGWDSIYVYAWGDDNDLFGGWPGLQLTETENVDGTNYLVAKVKGMGQNENLIFNNNAGVQLNDFNVILNKNYTLIVTAEGVTEK